MAGWQWFEGGESWQGSNGLREVRVGRVAMVRESGKRMEGNVEEDEDDERRSILRCCLVAIVVAIVAYSADGVCRCVVHLHLQLPGPDRQEDQRGQVCEQED